MPYHNREEQLEYMRDYYAWYRLDNEDAVKERQAAWFQDNKERLVGVRRRNRALKRSEAAIASLAEEWRELVRAAVRLEGESMGKLEASVFEGMVKPLPADQWGLFLDGLGARDRGKWEKIRGVL